MKIEFINGIEKLDHRGYSFLIRVGEFGSFWVSETFSLRKPENREPPNMELLEECAASIAGRLNKAYTEVKILERREKSARVSMAVLKPIWGCGLEEPDEWKADRSITFIPLSLIHEFNGKNHAPMKFVNKKLPGGRKAKPAKIAEAAEIRDWLFSHQDHDEMRRWAGWEWKQERVTALGTGNSRLVREKNTMDLDRDMRFADYHTGLALEFAKSHPHEAKALALHEAPFFIAKRAAVHPGVQGETS